MGITVLVAPSLPPVAEAGGRSARLGRGTLNKGVSESALILASIPMIRVFWFRVDSSIVNNEFCMQMASLAVRLDIVFG
jgi:hypothetical protein